MNTALTGEATLLEKRRDDAITEHKRAIDALNGRCAEMVQRYEDARTEVAEAKKAVEAERVARVASAEEEAKKSAAQLERARTGKLEAEKRSAAAKKELEALQIEHASLIKQSDDARKQLAETGAALGRAEQQIASQSTTIAEQQRRMALFDESKETVRLWVGHVTRSLADMKRQLSLWSGLDAADVEIEVIEDSEFVKTSNDDDVFRRQLTTNLEWLSDLISGLDEQLAHLGRRIPHNESNASEVPRSPGEGVRNTAPSAGPPSRGRQRKQQS